MKRKTGNRKTGNRKRGIALLFSVGVMLFTGCGGKQAEEGRIQPEQTEKQAGEEQIQTEQQPEEKRTPSEQAGQLSEGNGTAPAEAPVPEGEGVPDSADVEDAAEADGENAGETLSLYEAQVRHYYSGILSRLIAAWQLPDGGIYYSADHDEMEENQFAVVDIDRDGREELLIKWTNTITAGEFQAIYDYNPADGEVKLEFRETPSLIFYDNGVIKAEWLHNQVPPTDFWPFTLYQYEPESDSYVEAGSVSAWDKVEEGWDFPDERDVDGDGRVYEIEKPGEEYSDYEGFKYNQADFDEWFGGLTEGAKEVSVDYQPIAYESFADFTPTYLKLRADEAGEERTDTASDLGLLILQEEHFSDAAKTLLSEKYEVELNQPEPDYFQEWTVGFKDGKQVFSFDGLHTGQISYKGEQIEDVTIFGIYPGISVDEAWEKLKAYGFYASPYEEAGNCLITGEGFGNVGIWFSAEDNIVTEITAGPYCAVAR